MPGYGDTPSDGWFERARSIPIPTLAAHLGLTVGRGWLAPCPACGATSRSRHERGSHRRGPVGLRRDGLGWHCFPCGASGDGIRLVSMALFGTFLQAGDHRWKEVFRWFSDHEGMEPSRLCMEPSHPPARDWPPQGEVGEVWKRAVTLTSDPEAVAWCVARGLVPSVLVERDLARVVPPEMPLPSWAAFRQRTWSTGVHRLLVPLYDSLGLMRSFQARTLSPALLPKSVSPFGFSTAGLVMADPICLRLVLDPRSATPVRLVVVEGIPDFLTWATRWTTGDPRACPVLGVISGSWDGEIAGAVQDGGEVIIRTHADEAGDQYARAIVETLAERSVHLVRAHAGGASDGT